MKTSVYGGNNTSSMSRLMNFNSNVSVCRDANTSGIELDNSELVELYKNRYDKLVQ